MVHEVELRRDLLTQVLRLDEPYRSTMILRYFKEMPPREIASRQGIPVATVETRLHRALARMRQRLDAKHRGNRAAWCLPLLPLADPEHQAGPTLGLAKMGALSTTLGILAMSMKAKLGVTAALVVVTALFFWQGSDANEEPALNTAPSIVAARDDIVVLLPEESVVAAERLEEEAAPMETGTETVAPPMEAETPIAEGLLRLLHEDGRTDETLDGEVELVVWTGTAGEHQAHPVVAGRFRFEVEPSTELEVHRVTLDGVSAMPIESGVRHAIEDGLFVIEVRRPALTVLVVTDATEGLHLDHVSVIVEPMQLFGMGSSAAAYPGGRGARETIVTDATSPIPVLPASDLASRAGVVLHVGAAGYTWNRVVVDFSSGGERIVRLERGSSVDVFLEGAAVPFDARLRLRLGEQEGPPDLERRVEDETAIALEGLRSGEHTVQIDLGDWWDSPTVLAQETFTASPDERARVVLFDDPTLVLKRETTPLCDWRHLGIRVAGPRRTRRSNLRQCLGIHHQCASPPSTLIYLPVCVPPLLTQREMINREPVLHVVQLEKE